VAGKTFQVPRRNVVYFLWMMSPDLGVHNKAALTLGLVFPFKAEGKPKEKKKATLICFFHRVWHEIYQFC